MSRIFESMTMLGMLGGSGGGSGGSQNCLSLQTRKAAMPERDYPAWRTVVYGNDKFVAFPQAQSIPAYSGDGIYWQDAEIPDDLAINMGWNSVVYGQGKFVAVAGNTDKAAYSSDGINWTETTMPCSAAWYSVAYGNGRFVAVTYGGGYAAYSEDGVTWTEVEMPGGTGYWWSSIAFGNGRFVAVTDKANLTAYSEDGITWTETAMPEGDGDWYAVAFGGGKFVAVGIDNNRAAYSEDGISWTETTMPAVRKWRSVAYGNGRFVAVAEGTDKAAFSMDGITWTETNMPGISEWYCVAYGKGRFIAMDFDGPVPALSEDGITWVTEVDAIMQGGQDVTEQVSQAQAREAQGVILSGPAKAGQMIVVTEVDAEGRPTEWEPVDRTHWIDTVVHDPTYDGNLEGREYVSDNTYVNGERADIKWVKVSEETPTLEQLIGASLTGAFGGVSDSLVLSEDDASSLEDLGAPLVAISVNGCQAVYIFYENYEFESGGETILFTKGTYFADVPGMYYVESLSCLKRTTEKIHHRLDPGYLPNGVPYELPPSVVEILPETVVQFTDGQAMLDMMGIVAGEAYTVTWDSTEYECTAELVTVDGTNGILLGNPVIAGGEDNGLPFVVGDGPDMGIGLCVSIFGAAQATVRITQTKQEFKKLDNKLLDLGWLPIKTVTKEVLMQETVFESKQNATDIPAEKMTVGSKWRITHNGVEYVRTIREYTDDGMIALYVGNFAVLNSDAADTGEPFVFISIDGPAGLYLAEAGATVSVEAEIFSYSRLPAEYMPECHIMPTDWADYEEVEGGINRVMSEDICFARTALKEGRAVFAKINGELCKVLAAECDDSGYAKARAIGINDIYTINTFPGILTTMGESFLISPNGTKYKLTVADDGTLSTVAATT